MRIAIVGSREYPDAAAVRATVEKLARDVADLEIVSGGARGPDSWAVEAAQRSNIPVKVFPADWSKGRGAGFARNPDIVNYSDRVVAFWDGASHGTKHTIDLALKARKHLEVIFPES